MREIAIIGAGIGGLTAALSLHGAGFPVRVFESVRELRPLGVGINLLPHAVRELEELGLRAPLEAAGICCGELAYYTKRGQRIWSEPRGIAAGYRWPQISIHRGVLQMLLFETALERLGADRIELGMHLERFEAEPGRGVRAHFRERGDGAATRAVEAGLLVAADGIHSAVRRALYPGEGPPRWNGALMWRGVSDAAPFLDGRTMIMSGHASQKFVCYPIARCGARQSQNFVAELRFDAREQGEREDWSKPGRLEDFLPRFSDWQFEWLDVPALIRGAGSVWVYPMVDRDPLPRWSTGPVTLLGDAAHPMYPIGSNGASQAILDARVLTGCLRHYADAPEVGLARYDEIRRTATAEIVLANRRQGPEAAMQLVEDRAPDGFARIARGADGMTVELGRVLEIDIRVGQPVSAGATDSGEVRVVPFESGSFTGPGLQGRLLPGGSDWQTVRPDGALEIRAHYLLETDRAERIEVVSEGIRHAAPGVLERIARGEPVSADEYYFRTFIRLRTAAPRLAHLNRTLFVSVGERARDAVHLTVYEVP